MLPVSWKLTSAGGFVPGSYFPLTSGGFGPRQLLAADLKGAEFLPGSHQEPLDRLLGLGSEVAVGSQWCPRDALLPFVGFSAHTFG